MTRNIFRQADEVFHLFKCIVMRGLPLVCLAGFSPREAVAQLPGSSLVAYLVVASGEESSLADSAKILKASTDHQNMVLVEGGTFEMGSKINGPIHSVKVSSFYFDKYEITAGEFRTYCDATGISMPPAPPWGWNDNHPVVNVSWSDAAKYAAWAGKRLPTEAEWEFAARGGIRSEGYMFSGSNELGSVAWFAENSSKMTHPVGTKSSNELGLFDMSGNVSEWCLDWYDGNYYRSGQSVNPDGPDHGIDRVFRGGSYGGDDFDCRSTFRGSALPVRQLSHVGFRCVTSK
jgi:sulfatase modifying factor 1